MAGPRANLAVTKDGESYNKLKRPDDLLNSAPLATDAIERKRVRDVSPNERQAGNKRARTKDTSRGSKDNNEAKRMGGPVAECGMRETIPLGDQEYDDEELRPDDDALAYLLSVRSEASAIPRLLGGGPTVRHDHDDERVFCEDGTWFAIDDEHDDASGDDIEEPSPQEEYYKQLLKRFQTLRATFSKMRSQGLPQTKPSDTGRSSSARPPKNRHDWYCTMEREYPTPAQILQMDERAVLKGLEYCAHALRRFDTISNQKGCWIWTLLALLRDKGTMDHWKMAQVRDIGCRAGQLGAELRRGAVTCSYADIAEDSDADNDERSTSQDVDEGEEYEDEEDEEGMQVHPAHEAEQPKTHKTQNQGPSETSTSTQAQVPSQESADDSEAEMSMSEDEDEKQGNSDNEAVDLEKARARLLAQLGDRLVQPGIRTTGHSPDSGTPHTENGQVPQDVALGQDKPVNRSFPSRAEAERQRQQMREQERRQETEKEESRIQQHEAQVVAANQIHSMTAVDLNTRVTIDMILTVVADCYGQIDLLKFREVW